MVGYSATSTKRYYKMHEILMREDTTDLVNKMTSNDEIIEKYLTNLKGEVAFKSNAIEALNSTRADTRTLLIKAFTEKLKGLQVKYPNDYQTLENAIKEISQLGE